MAEANTVTHPSKPQSPKAHQNPSKPFSSILHKVMLVSVLISLLPIFPSSQSPESSNKSLLARSWELLHLLLVGIAISYGLFSRRNSSAPETEKETQLKADAPHSCASQILQASSVFDVEDVTSPNGLVFTDETVNQTWNYSQYYREEPVVTVAKQTADGTNSSSRKPLLLPVRSLKSRPQYPESFDSGYEADEAGKVVLPSPIPWRSRSGRMEVNEETSPPYYSPPNSAFDAESGPSRAPSFRSSTPHAASRAPSPKRPSPSPSISPENRRETRDEFTERMIISAPDSESSDDDGSELSDAEETPSSVPAEAEPEENEVDKKADEFIAKFREQIRLQRIASIKRLSGQRGTRNSN